MKVRFKKFGRACVGACVRQWWYVQCSAGVVCFLASSLSFPAAVVKRTCCQRGDGRGWGNRAKTVFTLMASTDEHLTLSSTRPWRVGAPESPHLTEKKAKIAETTQIWMTWKLCFLIASSWSRFMRHPVEEGLIAGLLASGFTSSTPCLVGWRAQVGVTRGQRDKGCAINSVLVTRDQRDACLFLAFAVLLSLQHRDVWVWDVSWSVASDWELALDQEITDLYVFRIRNPLFIPREIL